jgi:hypothetical protein
VCERKYMERFSNGLRVYSYVVEPTPDIDQKIANIISTAYAV